MAKQTENITIDFSKSSSVELSQLLKENLASMQKLDGAKAKATVEVDVKKYDQILELAKQIKDLTDKKNTILVDIDASNDKKFRATIDDRIKDLNKLLIELQQKRDQALDKKMGDSDFVKGLQKNQEQIQKYLKEVDELEKKIKGLESGGLNKRKNETDFDYNIRKNDAIQRLKEEVGAIEGQILNLSLGLNNVDPSKMTDYFQTMWKESKGEYKIIREIIDAVVELNMLFKSTGRTLPKDFAELLNLANRLPDDISNEDIVKKGQTNGNKLIRSLQNEANIASSEATSEVDGQIKDLKSQINDLLTDEIKQLQSALSNKNLDSKGLDVIYDQLYDLEELTSNLGFDKKNDKINDLIGVANSIENAIIEREEAISSAAEQQTESLKQEAIQAERTEEAEKKLNEARNNSANCLNGNALSRQAGNLMRNNADKEFTQTEYNDVVIEIEKIIQTMDDLGTSTVNVKKKFEDFKKSATIKDPVTQSPIEQLSGDEATKQWVQNLEKVEKTSKKTQKSIQEAIRVSSVNDSAGNSLELLNNLYEEIDKSAHQTGRATEAASEGIKAEGNAAETAYTKKRRFKEINESVAQSAKNTAKEAEKAADGIEAEGNAAANAAKKIAGYIRNQRGDASIGDDSYVEAISKVQNERVTNTAAGQTREMIVDFDKLTKELIKSDTQILELETKIKNTQGDTRGLEENLALARQQRDVYDDLMDYMVQSSQYEITGAHKDVVTAQRALNEEVIRNNQLTVDSIKNEKEREQVLKEEQKIRDALINQTLSLSHNMSNANRQLDETQASLRKMSEYTPSVAADMNTLRNTLNNVKTPKDFAAFVQQYKDFKSKLKIKDNSLDTLQNQNAAKAYDLLFSKASRYYELIRKNENGSISSVETLELQKLQNAWDDAIKKKHEYFYDKTGNNNSYNTANTAYQNFIDNNYKKYVQSLDKEVLKLDSDVKNVIKHVADNKDVETKAKVLEADIKNLRDNLSNIVDQDSLVNTVKLLDNLKDELAKIQGYANETNKASLANSIGSFINNNSAMLPKYKMQLDSLFDELLSDTKMEASRLEEIEAKAKKIMALVSKSGQNGLSFTEGFSKQFQSNQISQLITTFFSWQDWIRYAQELGQTVTDVDSALVELRKVSDASTERLQQNFINSTKTAKELGASITDVINSTADWTRAGFSVDEAEELARVSTLYQNVGDNLDAATANEYLVSTLRGFHMAANEAESIVDQINEVSKEIGQTCRNTWGVYPVGNYIG